MRHLSKFFITILMLTMHARFSLSFSPNLSNSKWAVLSMNRVVRTRQNRLTSYPILLPLIHQQSPSIWSTLFPRGYVRQSDEGIAATSPASEAIPQKTIAEGIFSDEQIIKKSRFIGIIQHCESWEDAQKVIASVRAEHPKSRHVCFGFVAGANPTQERSSDDGEPTGTGGSPVLGAIKGEGLSDTICAVVRYSGGIKLGAGGLIRAYGGTARLAIKAAETQILIPKSVFQVSSPGVFVGAVYETIHKYGGTVGEESYNENGDIRLTATCETEVFDRIKIALQDATRGEINFQLEQFDDES